MPLLKFLPADALSLQMFRPGRSWSALAWSGAAGLLLALLRRLPRAGDKIVFAGWRLEVTEMEGRRVASVRVSREAADGL